MSGFSEFHFEGLIIAVITFVIIGIFHPIVIHSEYRWGTKCWPVFALLGLGTLIPSFFIETTVISSILAVLSCILFWSVKELYDQKKRVLKGWFPMNPDRKSEYEKSEYENTQK